jgi:hypothetical protein
MVIWENPFIHHSCEKILPEASDQFQGYRRGRLRKVFQITELPLLRSLDNSVVPIQRRVEHFRFASRGDSSGGRRLD